MIPTGKAKILSGLLNGMTTQLLPKARVRQHFMDLLQANAP
jgi:hypothetical protein